MSVETKAPVPPYQESYDQTAAPQQPYGTEAQKSAPMVSQQGFIQQPMQGQPPQSQYRTATPLQSLSSNPVPVDCPQCGVRQLTRVEFENGNTTYGWALAACVVACLGCIPFLMTGTKDVMHYCGSCGTRLALWHRSGRIEVLAHA